MGRGWLAGVMLWTACVADDDVDEPDPLAPCTEVRRLLDLHEDTGLGFTASWLIAQVSGATHDAPQLSTPALGVCSPSCAAVLFLCNFWLQPITPGAKKCLP